jgi:hypothetical protein
LEEDSSSLRITEVQLTIELDCWEKRQEEEAGSGNSSTDIAV